MLSEARRGLGIRSAQITAARAVNRELILLYWDIGRAIVEKQQTANWGDSVVEQLAADLRAEFPNIRGFSANNLWLMRQFYSEYARQEFLEQLVQELANMGDFDFLEQPVPELTNTRGSHSVPETEFLRQLVAGIPWGQNVELLKKVKAPAARLYYLRATARFGWSRKVLLNQIKAQAYERATQEKKTHNFALALPEHFAEQADEMMKSRYNLEFLGIGQAMKERDLEKRLPAEYKGKLPTVRQLTDAVRRALPAPKEAR